MTDQQQQHRFVELAGVAACLLMKNLAWYYASKRRPKVQVGHVQQIVIYPVKSCRGLPLAEAEIRDGGIFWSGVRDRSYLVISTRDSKFLSLKVFPTLYRVQPTLNPSRPGGILLTADGHQAVSVPDAVQLNRPVTFGLHGADHSGLDCGDEIAAWLNAVCDRNDLRLAVNNRLNGKHPGVDWRSFRPNLVIAGVRRDREEDDWGFVFLNGGCVLAAAFPCERCIMVNLDYSAGDRAVAPTGNPVLSTLASYRRGEKFKNPLFGVNCTVETPGRVTVGEAVFADA